MYSTIQKISSYLGFAIKSREIVYGTDNLEKKKSYLILISSALKENSKNKCELASKKWGCPLKIIEEDEFKQLNLDEKIKVVSITNEQLAKAIDNVLNGGRK